MAYHKFRNVYGESYGSFETFRWDRFDCQDAGLIVQDPESETGWVCCEFGIGRPYKEDTDPTAWEGYYWQACWPGCLPDGDLMGPFPTEQDAINNANEHA